MNIGLIGSGNVAFHFAKALSKIDAIKLQIWGRNKLSLSELAYTIKLHPVDRFEDLLSNQDIIIIALKDDAIAEIAQSLQQHRDLLSPDCIVVHTSGAISMDVFKDKLNSYGVLYPLQTFSKEKELNFKAVPLFLEANSVDVLTRIEQLCKLLVEKYWVLDSQKRKVLHVAAVFACNFPNHLYSLAQDLLEESGMSFEMLKPLILETADKIRWNDPAQVQTGPAVRNDEQTLKNHEDMLVGHGDMLKIYQILSSSIKKKHN